MEDNIVPSLRELVLEVVVAIGLYIVITEYL